MPLHPRTSLPAAREILSGALTISADSVDEAHARISELFCDHRLAPMGRERVRMSLRSAHGEDVGIELLDYGSRVRISPVSFEDFHLVQIPLSGRATMNLGRVDVHSTPILASVPPIDRPFSMIWESGTPHLIVYIRRSALARAAAAIYGATSVAGVSLAPQLDLTTEAGQAFLRAVFDVHETLRPGSRISPYAGRLARETLLARLLMAVENSAGRSLGGWESAEETESVPPDALLRRLQDLLAVHAHEQLGVMDLAEALNIPLRTLQEIVRRETGSTPSKLLAEARLMRAHELLQAADPALDSVTRIAERCGFTHLGRFSSAYRDRFGDSPSQTLRS